VTNHADDIPGVFNEVIDLLLGVAGQRLPAGAFRTEVENRLNAQKNVPRNERLFNELHRELIASCFGRRDAQWALAKAIQNARQFIYLETPGLNLTIDPASSPAPIFAVDLFALLAQQLDTKPGLRVIFCVPKYPGFAPGYEPFAAHEAHFRREKILALPTAEDPKAGSRVVAFHPVGFPGRASRLESTVAIVDDVWPLVGSSTLRRRGLSFDGGSDLVFTDTDLVNGRSPAIAGFRRRLVASRLGVRAAERNEFGAMPDPTFVRLADGAQALDPIRDMLIAGGLGKIERLWNGETPGVAPLDPNGVPPALANPDGRRLRLPRRARARCGLSTGPQTLPRSHYPPLGPAIEVDAGRKKERIDSRYERTCAFHFGSSDDAVCL
jgi:hypothetical protein